jgi:hypothetical protein
MSNVTALEEIRQDKKKLEETIRVAVREFEARYPGFEVKKIKCARQQWRNENIGKFICDLKIKIPWL